MSNKRRAALIFCALAALALLSGCSGSSERLDEALSSPPSLAGELELMQVLNAATDGDYRSLGGEAMGELAGFVVFDDELREEGAQAAEPAGSDASGEQAAPAGVDAPAGEAAGTETETETGDGGGKTKITDYTALVASIKDGYNIDARKDYPEAYTETDAAIKAELAELTKRTGASGGIIRSLLYLRFFCAEKSVYDVLDVLESYLHETDMNPTRREAFESLYLRMLVGSLGDNEVYFTGLDSFESVYYEYIDIGVDGFEKRAFAELQTCPDPAVANEFLDFLVDNMRADEITSDLLVSAALGKNDNGSYYCEPYALLENADKFCFETDGGEAVLDGAIDKFNELGFSKGFDGACEDISEVINFKKSNPKLFDYLTRSDYNRSSSYYAFTVVKKDLYSDALIDRIYKADAGQPTLPPLDWTRDMLVDYFGSSSFTPSDPQYGEVLFVQDSEKSGGMDDVFWSLQSADINQTADPDKASAAVYYSVSYPLDSYYRFESGEVVPAYACYVSIKAVDLRTGATIGSLSYSSIPASQVSVYSVPDEWYEELPEFDYEELDALAAKIEAAVAEPEETEEEGI